MPPWPLPPARASGGGETREAALALLRELVLEPRHQVLPLDLLSARALLRLVARKVLARARSTGRALFLPRHVPNGPGARPSTPCRGPLPGRRFFPKACRLKTRVQLVVVVLLELPQGNAPPCTGFRLPPTGLASPRVYSQSKCIRRSRAGVDRAARGAGQGAQQKLPADQQGRQQGGPWSAGPAAREGTKTGSSSSEFRAGPRHH